MNQLTEDERKQIAEYAQTRLKSKDGYFESSNFVDALCPDGTNEAGHALVDIIFNKKTYPFTDLGNAERLLAKCGDIFRWVTERRLFIIWTGAAWVYDTADDTRMMKLAKDTIRDIISKEQIPNMPDDDYKKLVGWAISSESGKRLREMITLVKMDTTISINDLDKDPYLFNCHNATIDLHTGKARLHSKDDFLTITAPVDYIENAQCPKWLDFLNVIQAGNQGMITYLQIISGICLTGDTRTDIIPFCYGLGGNGKSTYWEVVRRILGAYAYEVDPDIFLISGQRFKDSGQREELVNLQGKRLVTATEIQENRQLTVNLLKAISGGESIHGDRKYERGVTFKPTFKVILSGNNEPVIKDNTMGTWRRLKKIPFTVTIQNPIEAFEDTFNDELPGILNWLIQGCLLWQREGLKDPDEVINATAEYRKDQDLISQFLDEHYEMSPDAETAKKDFRTTYVKWCTDNSCKAMTDKELKQKLLTFNIKDKRKETGMIWQGIRLSSKDVGMKGDVGKNQNSPTRPEIVNTLRQNPTAPYMLEAKNVGTPENDPDLPKSEPPVNSIDTDGENGQKPPEICKYPTCISKSFDWQNGSWVCMRGHRQSEVSQ